MQSTPIITVDAKRSFHKLSKLSSKVYIRATSSKDNSGWIYVFHEVGSLGGVFKVGRTNNLRRRMSEWEAACPGKRRIWLGALWTPFAHKTGGTVHIEKFVFVGDPQEVYEQVIKPVIRRVIASL
ncbi:hypothetical protein C8R42DRAFT_642429 [Lentinula raphanica]|nr:hypothetical protein C8R42DRAFT_642429 [Lentinula raphanica]